MSKFKNMDQTELLLKAMEQEGLLKECSELVRDIDHNHLSDFSYLSQQSQSLVMKINEALK